MKTKTLQLLLMAAAFVVMIGFIFFVESGTALTTVSFAFVFVIGAFLSLDLASMIKETSSLPKGKYQEARKNRYILSAIFLAVLCVEAFIVSKIYGRCVDGVYASIGVGFMVVIAVFISGVEANKIATSNGTTETGSE